MLCMWKLCVNTHTHTHTRAGAYYTNYLLKIKALANLVIKAYPFLHPSIPMRTNSFALLPYGMRTNHYMCLFKTKRHCIHL